MKNLIGEATVEYLGVSLPCEVVLNMGMGQIEITVAKEISAHSLEAFLQSRDGAPPKLKDLRFSTAGGELSLVEYDQVFMTEHDQGDTSVHQTTTQLTLRHAGERIGLTRMVLQPMRTRIDFDFKPALVVANHELTLEAAHFSTLTRLEIRSNTLTAAGVVSGSTLVLAGNESLKDQSEKIALAVGIAQGGPITIRSNVSPSNFSLNVAPHEHGSLGAPGNKPQHSAELIQRLHDFFDGLASVEYERYRRAAYFYLHGCGGKSPLDSRIINLYVALEMIDDTKSLTKKSVSAALHISENDADLICRVRNDLVHRGSSIGSAVLNQTNEIRSFLSNYTFGAFPIDSSALSKNHFRFYLALATLLCKYWMRKVGFEHPVYEYFDLAT